MQDVGKLPGEGEQGPPEHGRGLVPGAEDEAPVDAVADGAEQRTGKRGAVDDCGRVCGGIAREDGD